MEHLLTPAEVCKLGRPIGNVDPVKLTAYITETEQLYIKPVFGTPLFLKLFDDANTDNRIATLMDGGVYEDAEFGTQSFAGLKVTLSYFVFAQNVMSGDFQSTRYGIVVKDGDYSTHISSKERSDCYNNTLEIAHAYLRECVAYCKSVELLEKPGRAKAALGGITIRKIGK